MTIHRNQWLRSIMHIFLCTVLLLTACESDAVNSDQDGLDGSDLSLYLDDSGLQAGKFQIWWDEGFGAPYKEFMGEYLDQAFGKDRFDVFSFWGPFIRSDIRDTELFYELPRRTPPDLIVFDSRLLPLLVESNYLEPIDIESFLVLDPTVLDEIREVVPDRQLYALPYGLNVSALFYNKTIFDGMDVPYPTDGMTWDEVFELAAQIKDLGNWNSLDVHEYGLVASQLSLELFNEDTQLIDFDTEVWTHLELFSDKLMQVQKDGVNSSPGMSAFSVGDTAMIIGSLFYRSSGFYPNGLYDKESQLKLFDVDWDAVSIPVFDRDEPVAPANKMLLIGVPRMAENKEDAYKLVRYLLSEPVQFENMRRGLISLREDADARKEEFGTSTTLWAGKSTSYIYHSAPTGTYESVLDRLIDDILEMWGHRLRRANDLEQALGYQLEDPTNIIREYVTDYLGKRTTIITELQEKFREYERFNQ